MAAVSVSDLSNSHHDNDNLFTSYFQKTVSLCDWWLIKADKDFQGKRLAVAGVTSREQQVLRVFHSAPITKRYDVFTLETADGIIVVFQGFINKTRTIENGFPSEVFSHFLFGFPPYWEEYAENCFKQAVSSDFDFQNASDFDESTDQGSEDFRPIPSPYKNKDTSENELNIKAEVNISEKMLNAARILRNLSGNLKSKEKSEQISVDKGSSSMKKARRKISFDEQASPLAGKSKEKICILSPESLSLRRSRAGRLLLPTLDFWRNQIPVYDADRNITGIQEELKISGGCKSEPQSRSKRKGKS
ncbi:kinetochore-associated protein KNL-2 homolog isoform X2 [Hevea brasiliensis]|uniref:kinetochore-associated protein KNL-2 homolog isoform X2 n=1 Tax=Hevea brasiliensis TaxID=3981 RepID=UPI0025FA5FA2|nr:kinetochore-associated protein KNL-2 homolog isoform X2 [Hevea brasiliensis]